MHTDMRAPCCLNSLTHGQDSQTSLFIHRVFCSRELSLMLLKQGVRFRFLLERNMNS